jgi:hypothetical protein
MTTKHKPTTHEPEGTAPPSKAEPPALAAKATSKTTPATTTTPTTTTTPLVTATANGNAQTSKVGLQAVYQALIAGLLTYYAPTDIFHTAQGSFTRDELIAQIQSFVTACQTTQKANQSWRSAIQAERTIEGNIRQLRKGVRGIVQARFGVAGAQILQFGFPLPKPRKQTSETKAIAAKKSLATREARNTLGKVQKKNIKGNVSVAVVVTHGETAQGDGTAAATVAPAAGAGQSAGQAGATTVATATPGATGAPGGLPTASH